VSVFFFFSVVNKKFIRENSNSAAAGTSTISIQSRLFHLSLLSMHQVEPEVHP
jgi:hypothetical protein